MTWEIFVGITVVVGFIIAIVSPIIKLNSSITKLNCSIDTLNANTAASDKRIKELEQQNNELTTRVGNCENDIINMKEKIKYFHDV